MAEREVLDLDVLFVGAGPDSLAGAIYLKRLLSESGTEASVAVLEKLPKSALIPYRALLLIPGP